MAMRLARNRARLVCACAIRAAVGLLCIALSSFADDERLLILRGNGREFQDFVKGFTDELRDDFSVEETIVDSSLTPEKLSKVIKSLSPRMIVLLDNKAIGLYRTYSKLAAVPKTPVLASMGVFVEKAIEGIPNASGISYEIPVVTSVVSLRSTLSIPVRRVGIVHRRAMRDFVIKESAFCARENIQLVSSEIPERGRITSKTVRRSLKSLLGRENVDAIWIPNDIMLLRPEMIRDVWVPLTARYNKPVIVGVESLVNPQVGFGTLSVSPDHVALGGQAAQVVLETRDSGWKLEKSGVDRPLSIFKVINMRRARAVTDRPVNTSSIDKVLE